MGAVDAQKAFTEQIIVPIARSITDAIGRMSLYWGVAYAVAGAACYAISRRIKIKQLSATPTNPAQPQQTYEQATPANTGNHYSQGL